MPGPMEIALILLVIVLLFGARKLPELARSLGRSMRIFKSEVKEMSNDDNAAEGNAVPQQGQLTQAPQRPHNDADDEFWNSPQMQPRASQPRPEQYPHQ